MILKKFTAVVASLAVAAALTVTAGACNTALENTGDYVLQYEKENANCIILQDTAEIASETTAASTDENGNITSQTVEDGIMDSDEGIFLGMGLSFGILISIILLVLLKRLIVNLIKKRRK